MTPDMVAALERQTSVENTGDGTTEYRWRLVGEGLIVDLAAVGTERFGVFVQWMGAHSNQPFSLNGELREDAIDVLSCQAMGGAGWCAVDASRADRLLRDWNRTRDDAPIWAALEALAGEVTR